MGKGVERIITGSQFNQHPAWSPDGKQIAFLLDGGDGNPEIYVANADGSSVRAPDESRGDGPASHLVARTAGRSRFESDREGSQDVFRDGRGRQETCARLTDPPLRRHVSALVA